MTVAPSTPLPSFSRVAIIGAGGASGLAAIAQLLDKGAQPHQVVDMKSGTQQGEYGTTMLILENAWNGPMYSLE
ncbi:hypothetical protein I302_102686 [Kwoniella bestiolae CBS 10118]|uniref:Uncharacterized protein n=1 Tax=Kwoniella bestiolae CBS 10118 TaxID=1296100 RepID=A0AAJ8M7K4_9TREE